MFCREMGQDQGRVTDVGDYTTDGLVIEGHLAFGEANPHHDTQQNGPNRVCQVCN